MFVDELTIKLIAGSGGDGCTSFRREKFVPMGGPDGGNGGAGASIIFQADKSLTTLVDLSYKKIIKAPKGENGKGSNKYGANAEDVVVLVPLGTIITNALTKDLIADLTVDQERVVVAKGGRGGKGNKSFATHQNPAPKLSEKGEPGEEILVHLELKLLADVGLVGMPSVGKSTILSIVSASKPKIASYHFTTLSPNLGVVSLKDHRRFVMADLPGLIEGASAGTGLGTEFLRHAMRTKIIAHVIDMGAEENRDPIKDYQIIRKEIEKYSSKLAQKKEIIIASKMDLDKAKDNLDLFKKEYPDKDIIPISSYNNEGIDNLLITLANELDNIPDVYLEDEEDYKVYKYEEEKPFTITKDGDIWIIKGSQIEKLLLMTRFEERESVERFSRKFKGMGIEDELIRLGAKEGDNVQILDYMFIFKN